MNLIQSSLQSLLPSNRKSTSGGWVSFNAPCCTHRGESLDKKKRGGVIFTPDGFIYSCFNCGFKAGWKPGKSLSNHTKDLFHWLGMPTDDINKLILETLRAKDAIPGVLPTLSFELKEVELPNECLPIKTWVDNGCDDVALINVIDYITGLAKKQRALSLTDYNWHWSSAAGYTDRVFIPYYYNGRIVGWNGRKIKDGLPKYLKSTQSGYLFNVDAQTYDRAFVIVVEGEFDAIAISGVAILSNNPNAVQCARINALTREVIVVPDRDLAGMQMINHALAHGWSISIPPWEDDIKDVADAVKRYGKLYTLASILHYKESNKIKIELHKNKLERLYGN